LSSKEGKSGILMHILKVHMSGADNITFISTAGVHNRSTNN